MKKNYSWLGWAREIQAIAQTGLMYALNQFQVERYNRLLEISAEIIQNHSSIEYDDIMFTYSKQQGYATPKIDVRGAVFKSGELLLVKEASDGGWCLPGGWVDVNDSPASAVEREILEESGITAKPVAVIGVYDAARDLPTELFHAFKIIFHCEYFSGEVQGSTETTDGDFFSLENIPYPLSSVRTSNQHIIDAFQHNENPGTKTLFD